MKPDDMKIMVVEANCAGYWGMGNTLVEALKVARNPRYYRAYIATPSTFVTGSGNFNFPIGNPPKEVIAKLPSKKVRKKPVA